MAVVVCITGCNGSNGGGSAQESRASSLNADLGNDYTGNYLWVHGTRSVSVDAKYPCLNEVETCLPLDRSGTSPAVLDLCPSVDTPEGTWTFEYALHTDQDCTQPLGNVNCVIDEGTTLAPGENHRNVRCMTSNAITDFKVCLYDPVTGAGFGACNPDSCVYVNNDTATNSVTAFKVDGATGSLTQVGNYATGGTGNGGGLYAANRITAQLGKYLYASNSVSGTIAAFSIDPFTCGLTPVSGSPVAAEPYSQGISLAPTPDGKYLYVGAGTQLYAYAVQANGALMASDTYALTASPDGMKVSPDGKFLAIASYYGASVAMFGIEGSGALTQVPGSPFAADSRGGPAGVEINCASDRLFVGESSLGNGLVDVFAIAADGSLNPDGGTAYLFPGTTNSNVAVLSPDDQFLFVGNPHSGNISVARVGDGGSLTAIAGSPFPTDGVPSGMATDATGQFLYAASWGYASGAVLGFRIGSDGALTPVSGLPFALPNGIQSLVVFPPKTCP